MNSDDSSRNHHLNVKSLMNSAETKFEFHIIFFQNQGGGILVPEVQVGLRLLLT